MYWKKYLIPAFFSTLLIYSIPISGNLFAGEKDSYKKVSIKGEKGLDITADLYTTGNKSAPIILLFHQAHTSRGEYRQIAPELVKMGFNCLAVDTRAGGTDFWNNVKNETTDRAAKLNLPNTYLAAYSELESALKWVVENGYNGKIIVWGSSFSSTLVFKLAGDYKNEISGLLSFSPGEYYDDNQGIVADWAKKVDKIPCFVTCGASEEQEAKLIFNAVKSNNKKFYLPKNGRHGSSILMEDNSNWKEVKIFLEQFIEKK